MKVTVRGDQLQAPLLETTDATAIEFRTSDGRLVALFAKDAMLGGYWTFVSEGEEDWEATLRRLGYKQDEECLTTGGH
jgi:hypothetical protein